MKSREKKLHRLSPHVQRRLAGVLKLQGRDGPRVKALQKTCTIQPP